MRKHDSDSYRVTPHEATDGSGVGKSCETLTQSPVTFSAAFGLKSTILTHFSSHQVCQPFITTTNPKHQCLRTQE